MDFRPISPADYQAVRQFLAENGREKRVADTEKFRRMRENASRTIVAFEGDRVIGFARDFGRRSFQRLYWNRCGRRRQTRSVHRARTGRNTDGH